MPSSKPKGQWLGGRECACSRMARALLGSHGWQLSFVSFFVPQCPVPKRVGNPPPGQQPRPLHFVPASGQSVSSVETQHAPYIPERP